MTATGLDTRAAIRPAARVHRRRLRPGRVLAHAFLIVTSVGFLTPLVWTVYTSLRSYAETRDAKGGYFSWIQHPTLENYRKAWTNANLPHYFLNTIVVVIPAMVIILLLASFMGFALTRFSFKVNLLLLMVFTAGNLLPQQVIITPLYHMYRRMPLFPPLSDNGVWFNQLFGVMMIHVAFQLGFCTFVMSNYMKTIPVELTEAALVDGASVWRQFWQVILPLTRPAMAALATLQFIWIYNDFFWALVLIQRGDRRPIVSSLNNLKGVYFSDPNLLTAGALLIALPTLIVFIALQKQFVSGLTLGANKG